MFFKKKYEKSEWFQGLLEAERLIQDGYQKDYSVTEGRNILYLWFTKFVEGTEIQCKIGIDSFQFDRCRGIVEYIQHYEKYLK